MSAWSAGACRCSWAGMEDPAGQLLLVVSCRRWQPACLLMQAGHGAAAPMHGQWLRCLHAALAQITGLLTMLLIQCSPDAH